MEARTENLHATAIAVAGRGVLLRGASGAGKSDLALRCLTLGAASDVPVPIALVADDRVDVRRDGARLIMSAPAALMGLIEVRGVGLVQLPALTEAELALVVDLVAPAEVPRLPDAERTQVCGIGVPLLRLAPFEPSAAAKVLIAATRLG